MYIYVTIAAAAAVRTKSVYNQNVSPLYTDDPKKDTSPHNSQYAI